MKRILFAGLLILTVTIVFVACQKEFSVEHGIIPGQLAKGSLKDTSGNCLPDSIHGTWYNGVAPGDSNYVEIQVNVDSIGTYVVYTDMQNGLSFRDSGSFTSTGLNTIKLKPTGTPIAHDPTFFTVYFDTSICEFTLPVTDSTGTGLGSSAEYTLSGSPDECINYSEYGKWAEQEKLDSLQNVVNVEVNVTKIGKYTVTVGPVNGITFNASGTFTTTGTQEISLHATGTPTTAGTNTFPITVGTSSCSFTIFVINSVNASPTSWQLSEGTNNYSGFTYSASIADSGAFKVLYVYGFSPATFDTSFTAAMLYTKAQLEAGDTYNTNNTTAQFALLRSAGVDTIYSAFPGNTNVNTTFTISGYDASTKILDATFAGTALTASGATANITNGKLKVKVDN